MFFLVFIFVSDLYLFQEAILLSPCLKLSKNLMLLFADKENTRKYSLVLLICSVALVVSVAYLAGLGGLGATAGVLDISEIKIFFDQDKSSSMSQLIKGK